MVEACSYGQRNFAGGGLESLVDIELVEVVLVEDLGSVLEEISKMS
jgi:hypothetical protein